MNILIDYACVLSAYFREAEAGNEKLADFIPEVPESFQDHFTEVRKRIYRSRKVVKALKKAFGVSLSGSCLRPSAMFEYFLEETAPEKVEVTFHSFFVSFAIYDNDYMEEGGLSCQSTDLLHFPLYLLLDEILKNEIDFQFDNGLLANCALYYNALSPEAELSFEHEKRHMIDHFIRTPHCPFLETQAYMFDSGSDEGFDIDLDLFVAPLYSWRKNSRRAWKKRRYNAYIKQRNERYFDTMRAILDFTHSQSMSKAEQSYIFSLINSRSSTFFPRY